MLAAASYRAETAAEGAVAIRKKQRAIAAPDVLGKFNDMWIAQLGEIAAHSAWAMRVQEGGLS